ncbi:hypothetical protein DYL61_13720 [Pseudomonas nabeulensis]|uniref:Uncharacterized protein n=1 Tax=Pseudomonas nabeulensis TaxID=2293833 RepID=A0A4Z0B4M2_9PSED|nr:hypothetical protein DYL61_13720 [Pseudomonas nabeulensis]
MWRASLLALGCEAAPTRSLWRVRHIELTGFGAAARPSASKLARHNKLSRHTRVSRHRLPQKHAAT